MFACATSFNSHKADKSLTKYFQTNYYLQFIKFVVKFFFLKFIIYHNIYLSSFLNALINYTRNDVNCDACDALLFNTV